jgi:hypothetical protein
MHASSSNSIQLQLSANRTLLTNCSYLRQQIKISFGISVTSFDAPPSQIPNVSCYFQVTSSLTMRQIFILSLFFLSTCTASKKMTPSICDDYFKSVKVHAIKGTNHCRSITIANNVIIRTEENNASLLTHIAVINCPDSYKIYGDIGANGVIVEDTKQTFDFITPSKINFRTSYSGNKNLYFLNGFLITNDSLRISRNAIKKVEVLKPNPYFDTVNNDSTILVNIWTLTKKEVRKSMSKCKRSYD